MSKFQILPHDQFIAKAIAAHGNRYDYSKTIYTKAHDPIKIICAVHGEFTQKAYSHLSGRGCNLCSYECRAKKQSYTLESFIEKATAIHSDKYDYSLVSYNGNKKNVPIICAIHGEFLQSPANHMKGQGCPVCGIDKIKTNLLGTADDFINKANKVHNFLYGYENVIYNGNKKNVIITCPEHGGFKQAPSNHLQGAGCPECARLKSFTHKLKSTEQFIKEATAKHNGRYEYSLVEYKKSNEKVKIICKE
ncbi:MAG: hypothetical protein PHW53_04935, partial [Patescibacteria group bacterium]|nr:hypothetical protein [Patescibacteria group bacterium]